MGQVGTRDNDAKLIMSGFEPAVRSPADYLWSTAPAITGAIRSYTYMCDIMHCFSARIRPHI